MRMTAQQAHDRIKEIVFGYTGMNFDFFLLEIVADMELENRILAGPWKSGWTKTE